MENNREEVGVERWETEVRKLERLRGERGPVKSVLCFSGQAVRQESQRAEESQIDSLVGF
jgi:hypothetical protein